MFAVSKEGGCSGIWPLTLAEGGAEVDGTKHVLGLFRCSSVAVAALIAVDEGAQAC